MSKRKLKIGLFYGSDTGYTKGVAEKIAALLGTENVDVYNIADTSSSQISEYSFLILGLSTWHDGQLQYDWDNFFEELTEIDFSGKVIALFGLGDQVGYSHYFVDGIGIIGEVVYNNGGELIGVWPTDGYDFDNSKAVFQEGWFLGLAIDEDNQPHLTDERVAQWVSQVREEFHECRDKNAVS